MTTTCGSGPSGIACHIASLPGDIAGSALSSGAKSALHDVAQQMATAADEMLHTLTKMWMDVDTPSLTGSGSPVTTIQNGIQWITLSAAVVCVIIAAARMAIRRRGEPFSAMALGLVRLIVVTAAASGLVQLAGKAGDELSTSLMNAAHLGTSGWSGVISTTAITTAFGGGDELLLLIALIVVLSALIQLMLMVLRIGLLIILTGTLPLAAAAGMSDWGETWWRKHLAWLVAWLLYKPAAALLFAGAITLTQNGQPLVSVAAGFMLLAMMVLLLPAMLKLIVPVTSALGAASGGGLALGAAGAVATGAIKAVGTGGIGAALAGLGRGKPSSGSGSTGDDGDGGDDSPTGSGSTVENPLGGSDGADDGGPSGVTTDSAERPSPGSSGSADSDAGADNPSMPSDFSGLGTGARTGNSPAPPDYSDGPASGADPGTGNAPVPSGGSMDSPVSGSASKPASGATGEPPGGTAAPVDSSPAPSVGSQSPGAESPFADDIPGPSGSPDNGDDAPAENGG